MTILRFLSLFHITMQVSFEVGIIKSRLTIPVLTGILKIKWNSIQINANWPN